MNSKILKLLVSLAIPQLVGGLGALFTTTGVNTWYAGIVRPPLNPPNWVFGPVWTILYLLMGIAVYLVWVSPKPFLRSTKKFNLSKRQACAIFDVQLALNFLWSVIFFRFQSPGLAVIEILILWGAILANIFAFYKFSKTAAYLLIPYLLWVSFATYLNYAIWLLN